ncbi:MAG: ATP-binding cassette domain-containing protein, partial [Coriobacteriales bacterium]|nr:ATP-binding cassette domain-containing protein [Coriobacteriales bacterium]
FEDGRLKDEFSAEAFDKLSADERSRRGLRESSLHTLFSQPVSSAQPEPSRQAVSSAQPERFCQIEQADQRAPAVVRAEGLRCSYGKRTALTIESLEIQKGEVVALIGANGAGKSTLAHCLCGTRKHEGRVSVGGEVVKRRRRLNMSSMVMQDVNHQLFTESVRDELLLSGRRGRDAVKRSGDVVKSSRGAQESEGPADEVDTQTVTNADDVPCVQDTGNTTDEADTLLSRLGLTAYAEHHPLSLSGGQKQRVAIAAALSAHKRLLFFDEPTSGLDHTGLRQFCGLIETLGPDVHATIIITHDLELIAGCCTSVLRLEEGRVAEQYPLDETGRKRLMDWGGQMMQENRELSGTETQGAQGTQLASDAATEPGTQTEPDTTTASGTQAEPGTATEPDTTTEPGPTTAEKPPDFGRLMQFAMLKKGLSLSSVILAALAGLCGFVPFIAIYGLINELVILYPDFAAADSGLLMRWGWLALGGIAGNIVLYFLALCFSHIAAFGTIYQLKIEFASHLAKLPLGFHVQMGSGRLRKVMDENIEKIEGFIAHQLPDIVAGVVAPLAMIVILLVVDWRFGLASMLGIACAFAVQARAYGGTKVQKMARIYQTSLEEMSNATVEYVRGISVVKAFHQTAYSFTRLRETIRTYTDFVIPYTLSFEKPMSLFVTLVNNIYLFVVPLGIIIGLLSPNGADFAAHFLFYLVFVPCIASVMMKLLYVATNFIQISSGVAAMDAILSQPVLPESPAPLPISERHDIVFEEVRFSYQSKTEDGNTQAGGGSASGSASGSANSGGSTSGGGSGGRAGRDSVAEAEAEQSVEALSGVSFTAREGEVTALVGPSGSGKTTIAHLIPRFFDVSDGHILLGGIDVRDLALEQLMNQVSFVFQDVYLFKQSVRDNIRMAAPEASDEQVEAAARAAQCHGFIERLPQGYDTIIGADGVHLSGGEQQRIALARAIIKDAPVVVLDEATAFADPENEHLIQQAFEVLMRGKTVVMIAHRLSTVTGADRILVVDKGQIVEEGRHEELLARKGRYATMWNTYEKTVSWTMTGEEEKEACHV